MKRFFLLIAVLSSCVDGSRKNVNSLTVSIEPLRFLVSQIVGPGFSISVLVPPGVSPETWEPSPERMIDAENSRLVFYTGLIGFEQVLTSKLPDSERLVDLSAGIQLIDTEEVEHELKRGHHHGAVDPHIWMSPRALLQMARTAYDKIHETYPDSVLFSENFGRLESRLIALDSIVSARLAHKKGSSFLIFHPGLTYFARDYDLHQIALETDGKEPSAKQLAQILKLAKKEKINRIFYQREFPIRVVKIAAAEIDATPVEIDILGTDVEANILKISKLIASQE